MRPRPAVPVALCALILVAAAACSSDGRELRPPSPEQTASILTAPTTGPATTGDAIDPIDSPTVSLPWPDTGVIPVDFTCQGLDVSPAVVWSGLPEGTAEIAIVMTDPDAGGFIHWVVAGLDPTVGQVGQNGVPEDASQSRNDFGGVGYKGPCPVAGTHSYFVTVYALREASNLADGGDPAAAITRLDELQLASTTQIGSFTGP